MNILDSLRYNKTTEVKENWKHLVLLPSLPTTTGFGVQLLNNPEIHPKITNQLQTSRDFFALSLPSVVPAHGAFHLAEGRVMCPLCASDAFFNLLGR